MRNAAIDAGSGDDGVDDGDGVDAGDGVASATVRRSRAVAAASRPQDPWREDVVQPNLAVRKTL